MDYMVYYINVSVFFFESLQNKIPLGRDSFNILLNFDFVEYLYIYSLRNIGL